MSLHTTDFAPLAGPYRRRTRWQRIASTARAFVRWILQPTP